MFFSVSIYAPLVEELIFRKSIKDTFDNFGNNRIINYLYIITSGFIFAGMHVLDNNAILIDYLYIIPYLGLGCAMSAVYTKTNNIFSSIMIHFFHNTIAILLLIGSGI